MGSKQTKVAESISGDNNAASGVQLQEISEIKRKTGIHQDCVENSTPKMAENLRKRFFGGFIYNLNDPRSPGLNRTPLVYDENEKTLNLDDTFADLFVTNRAPTANNIKTSAQTMDIVEDNSMLAPCVQSDHNSPGEFNDFEKSLSGNESGSLEFTSVCEEETMPSSAMLQQTPLMYQQLLDPRSPTIGLTRTPIIFDDENAEEDAMLEDILATLSLDLTTSSSVNSFGIEIASPVGDVKKPTNKHLERVKKPEKPKRKSKQLAQKHKIYLESENIAITPKRKTNGTTEATKRTPLSCMINRSHIRSRSVESNGKSSKPRLSLTSYDDTLNPVQDHKVIDLHVLQGDPFEL